MKRREHNTRLTNPKTLTVGLDLGDRRHTACVLDEAGDIVAEEAFANTREVLTAFSARYPGATFVMETGTHRPWGPISGKAPSSPSWHLSCSRLDANHSPPFRLVGCTARDVVCSAAQITLIR